MKARSRVLATTVVAALALSVSLTHGPTEARASTTAIPTQYIAKVYTEGLGRAPDASSWNASVAYFNTLGCSAASLQSYGELALLSTEFSSLGYDNASKALVGYRTVLNREPDASGLASSIAALNGGLSWPDYVDLLFSSSEFVTLSSTICSVTTPDYNFGTAPAVSLPLLGAGFSGTQAQLQAALDAASPGHTVWLAGRHVVPLTSPLTVPEGVTLRTTGSPAAANYADMARLIRANSWPTFSGAAVRLEPGAKLENVWVDGQMGVPSRYLQSAGNVLTLSGTGTAVTNSRLSNTAGAYNLGGFGGADEDSPCVDNVFSYNLIDSYSSARENGTWTDGISIGCEDATISHNDVVDASDVGIITFGQEGLVQGSYVHSNRVINAGNRAFGSLAVSPFIDMSGGDGPGVWSRDFSTSVMTDNQIWNTPRAPIAIGISVGVTAWSGPYALNGSGQVVTNNNSAGVGLWAQTGIVVSGMLNSTVTGNSLATTLVSGQSTCPSAAVGADVTGGYASGTIQGSYLDTAYYACIS